MTSSAASRSKSSGSARVPKAAALRASTAVAPGDLAPIAPIKRADFNRSALVHRSRINRRRKFARIGQFRLNVARGNGISQFVLRIPRHDQPEHLARRIVQRVAHCMQTK